MQDTGVIDGRDMTGNGPQMTGLVKLNAPACCYSRTPITSEFYATINLGITVPPILDGAVKHGDKCISINLEYVDYL